ncbi:MAG: FMN-binding protein [Desulfobacteraceae bacterium]|nr:MAG: FMN-binding protein [Desulfobacteraceae bacterium]
MLELSFLHKDQLRAVRFAAIVSFISCMMITAASSGLKHRQLENIELDKQKNILKAAGLIDDSKPVDKSVIKSLFDTQITHLALDGEGQAIAAPTPDSLNLYLHRLDSRIISFIIPIDSRGLWGKINGYIALAADGETVVGFSIYSHSETPGLGGEIEKQWFSKNFVGKKIVNATGQFVSVAIAKGKVTPASGEVELNTVDGISGATLTGKYLSEGIKIILEQYEPVSVRFRQGDYTGFK